MTGIIRQLIVPADLVALQSGVQSSEKKSQGKAEKQPMAPIFTCFTLTALWKTPVIKKYII